MVINSDRKVMQEQKKTVETNFKMAQVASEFERLLINVFVICIFCAFVTKVIMTLLVFFFFAN